jgi:putative transposase
MIYPKDHADFITITCLEWKHILADDLFKDIVLESLRFLVRENRIYVFAFVIMSNHMHLIWQMLGDHKREDVQRDFLRYTSQQILKHLRNMQSPLLEQLIVSARDRKHQVWERNALSIPVYSDSVLTQKLDYIHYNPVKAGLCNYPTDYKYSSATFYYKNVPNFDFLSHYNG